MLTIQSWSSLSQIDREQRLTRPFQDKSPEAQVKIIITAVQKNGDNALIELTKMFDGAILSDLSVTKNQLEQATIDEQSFSAIQTAIKTITTYHQAMMPKSQMFNTAKGIEIEKIYRPINKVGLYIPGGNNTPLISSLLMQAIPASVAGCPIRILCTPPDSNGAINPHLLVAARLCQIDTIFKVGGAQAIAAMAYGTETIPKVDKIFGPGNRYVTEAKTQVSIDPAGAAIDMPAGPSEVMIIADAKANPDYVAADLLAQAEHGNDSQVILVSDSEPFAQRVNESLTRQFEGLNRKAIMQAALSHSSIIITNNREQTLAIINRYAPEHLIINRADAKDWVPDITNAGTIFLGPWAAETMGDYVTGSNHVLPTNGFARNHSGLTTSDFLKAISVQSITSEGIAHLGGAAYTLAMLEGLDAHANAVSQRLMSLGG